MAAAATKPKPKSPRRAPAKKQQAKPPLLGVEQARIFTPPKRRLTPKTSRGWECIAFAENVLGVHLFPWQKWTLIHALELNPDGTFRFRTVILLVARQNGKSLLLQVLSLWRIYVDNAPLVIGTAQNLDIAEKQWSEAVAIAEDNEDLAAEIVAVDKTNGKKSLRVETQDPEGNLVRSQYKVTAATRKGARGLSGDLVILDELREHSNWDAWGAVTKTTMARPKAQVWGVSNAGDVSSVVLSHLRNNAKQLIETNDTEEATLGLIEYSAPEEMPTSDRRGWAMANPSVGHADADGLIRLTEEALASAHATDPDPIFRVECLCQWVSVAALGPWEEGVWEAGRDINSKRVGGYYFGVDVSWDRKYSCISVAGLREDGKYHVEVVAYRADTDWVIPWLTERKDREGLLGVALQENGSPVSSLLQDMVEAGIPTVGWGGGELGRGTGQMFDKVRQGQVMHLDQEVLNLAASTAQTKPIADYWVWDRKRSPFDVSPLISITAAVWALSQPVEEQRKSAYDNEEMIFV
ncbi:terminase [Arthrobacter phage AppleCider]|uniref:Terminase n=1 Tax=Arthrobacter phage CallieOMalley TaxID=2488955 RepID=A0A3G8FSA8_9CAUD|nr:terminase [Arthrobacter phage CallieOMalley]QHB47175.1 terminase [Arthrobacter phage AppleCider]